MTVPDRPEMVTPRPWAPETEPTDAQLADWLARATVTEREWWVASAREIMREAGRCFMEDHDGRLKHPPPRWWTPYGIVG